MYTGTAYKFAFLYTRIETQRSALSTERLTHKREAEEGKTVFAARGYVFHNGQDSTSATVSTRYNSSGVWLMTILVARRKDEQKKRSSKKSHNKKE